MSRHIATTVLVTTVAAILLTTTTASGAPGGRNAVPTNLTLPTVSGTAQQGLTLTTTNGTWSGSPTSYTYDWTRCDTAGGNCAVISGTKASSYTLTSADVNHTLRAYVNASNAAGTGTALSAATGVVTATSSSAPPSNSSLPTVSGTAQQGLTLTTTNGTWSGSPTSYTYAWKHCDPHAFTSPLISGSKASSYTLTSADVNNTLRAYVNASNSAGTGTALSAATGVVTATSSTDTSVIDDEGTIRMGNSPAYMTNGDKFGTLALGSYYNLFQALPGRTIKYVNGAFCLDGDDVAASSATCRANGWLLHNSSGQELNSSYGFLLANTGNVSFQNDFLQRVLNFLTLHPWIDGVYFDNGALSMPQQMGVSYPIYDQSNRLLWSNDTDFQRAQIAFMANVAGALKARGYVVGYNARGYDGTGASNDGTLAKW